MISVPKPKSFARGYIDRYWPLISQAIPNTTEDQLELVLRGYHFYFGGVNKDFNAVEHYRKAGITAEQPVVKEDA